MKNHLKIQINSLTSVTLTYLNFFLSIVPPRNFLSLLTFIRYANFGGKVRRWVSCKKDQKLRVLQDQNSLLESSLASNYKLPGTLEMANLARILFFAWCSKTFLWFLMKFHNQSWERIDFECGIFRKHKIRNSEKSVLSRLGKFCKLLSLESCHFVWLLQSCDTCKASLFFNQALKNLENSDQKWMIIREATVD